MADMRNYPGTRPFTRHTSKDHISANDLHQHLIASMLNGTEISMEEATRINEGNGWHFRSQDPRTGQGTLYEGTYFDPDELAKIHASAHAYWYGS